MDQKHKDEELKQKLMKESDYPNSLKEDMWAQIQSQLDHNAADKDAVQEEHNNRTVRDGQHNHNVHTNHKGRNHTMKMIKWTTGVAAAAIAVTAFLALPPGTAMMKSVQNWFAPEKKIEVSIEGEKEDTQGQVHVNEESRYAIYYDKDRYKMVQENGKDVITTIEPLPEPYPQVSLTIEQEIDMLPEQLAAIIAEKLGDQFAEVRAIEKVSVPVEGYRVHAVNGNDRLSEIATVYVTSNEQQGSFVLTMQYFLEAAEGHGARFTQTLEQFEVLKEEQ